MAEHIYNPIHDPNSAEHEQYILNLHNEVKTIKSTASSVVDTTLSSIGLSTALEKAAKTANGAKASLPIIAPILADGMKQIVYDGKDPLQVVNGMTNKLTSQIKDYGNGTTPEQISTPNISWSLTQSQFDSSKNIQTASDQKTQSPLDDPNKTDQWNVQFKEEKKAALILINDQGQINSQGAGSDKDNGIFVDFILASVTDQRSERYQIVETFDESYIYFFGKRPRVINISGMVYDLKNRRWLKNLVAKFEGDLRGTELVRHRQRVYLTYDDVTIEGYILDLNITKTSDNLASAAFNMNMFTINRVDGTQDRGASQNTPGGNSTVNNGGSSTSIPEDSRILTAGSASLNIADNVIGENPITPVIRTARVTDVPQNMIVANTASSQLNRVENPINQKLLTDSIQANVDSYKASQPQEIPAQ